MPSFATMKLPNLSLLLSATLATAACQSNTTETTAAQASANTAVTLLTPGPWRGELAVQGQQIPFLFEVKREGGKPVLYLINKGLDGEQRLRCREITQAGDSVTVRMPTADAVLVLRADGTEKLKGVWAKYDAKEPFRVPLTAMAGEQQLFYGSGNQEKMEPAYITSDTDPKAAIPYKTTFRDKDGKSHPAVGLFKFEKDHTLTGAFFSTTGDYNYLSGSIEMIRDESHFLVSTFDGNHAFLVKARFTDSFPSLKGDFYSDKSGHETFTAVLDSNLKP